MIYVTFKLKYGRINAPGDFIAPPAWTAKYPEPRSPVRDSLSIKVF